MGVWVNLVAVGGVLGGIFVILIIDLLTLYKNLKVDPIYLAFAYFVPPSTETFKKWYDPTLHVAIVTALGISYFLEGVRTFTFTISNTIIVICNVKTCLNLINQYPVNAPRHMTVATKLENGVELYDTFCIIMQSGHEMQAFNDLTLLGLGYAITMFNAATTVAAWDILPPELVWGPLLVKYVGAGTT